MSDTQEAWNGVLLLAAGLDTQGKHEAAAELRANLYTLTAELARLREWKRSMLEVESAWEPQDIAKVLGIPLGASIRQELMPRITSILTERDKARRLLADFASWADSYPPNVWHVPEAGELEAAHKALKDAGLGGIDALSAAIYRHALTHVSERAKSLLEEAGAR